VQQDAKHAVRDWVLWQINDNWQWPNFNVADSLLVIGAGIIFLRIAREPAGTPMNGHVPGASATSRL
jgi:signal peptidase II